MTILPLFAFPVHSEIPLLAERMAASGKYDALVCLGAVIRGDTPHFEYVSDAVTRGIGEPSQSIGFPLALEF